MVPTLATLIDPAVLSTVKARSSSGLTIQNSSGASVLLLGAGPSQDITAYGQINGTSVALSAGLTCTTVTASNSVTTGTGIQVKGNFTPANGAGVEIVYASGTGFITAYDRDGAAWRPWTLRGSQIAVNLSGSDAVTFASGGTTFAAGITCSSLAATSDCTIVRPTAGNIGFTIGKTGATWALYYNDADGELRYYSNVGVADRFRLTTAGALTVTAGITCTAVTASDRSTFVSATSGGSGSELAAGIRAGNTGAANKFAALGYDGTADAAYIQGIHAGTAYKPILINPNGQACILGTDPGGSELLRVGGTGRFASSLYAPAFVAQAAAPVIEINRSTAGNFSGVYYRDTSTTKYNWIAGAQYNTDNGWEICASSAVGGSTYNQTLAAFVYDGTRKVGFYGVTPVARAAAAAAATDAATTQTLANSLRTILINLGLAS